jgi:hypothetical protein
VPIHRSVIAMDGNEPLPQPLLPLKLQLLLQCLCSSS